MRRSLTGSSLAILLLVVITMQQVVLGFCECAQTYFADTCQCQCEEVINTCHDECDGCHVDEHGDETPVKDCESRVSLDPGNFQWNAHELPEAHFTVSLIELPSPSAVMRPTSLPSQGQVVSSRGSPPGDVPLFLRDSVFRL